jgi:pimeloyl-ACP methyl ester carboxylesterase
MKTLRMALMTMVMIIAIVAHSAGPNLATYRYQNGKWIGDEAAWPQGRTALLIHGFPMFNTLGTSHNDLLPLAIHLAAFYPNIYAVEYPSGFSIVDTAEVLSKIVMGRCSNGAKIDVFAHSMGGIIARTTIELPKLSIVSRVSHLVTMGTPHNGLIDIAIIDNDFLTKYPEVKELDPDNYLIKLLNFQLNTKVMCDYYAIVGTDPNGHEKYLGRGVLGTLLRKFKEGGHIPYDGLIDADSAGFNLSGLCHGYKKAELALNHDYIKSDPQVFAQIDKWIAEDHWFGDQPAAQPKITKFTGGVPMLLGKTKAEVRRIMGPCQDIREHLPTDPPNEGKQLFWGYEYDFSNYITDNAYLKCAFAEYGNMDQNSLGGDGDHVHVFTCTPYYASDGPPSKYVPKEILAIPPSIFCCPGDELLCYNLIVIWFIDGKTYFLFVHDTKRKLYDCVETRDGLNVIKKRYLNDNGRDFLACDRVGIFICIDKIPDLFVPKILQPENIRLYDGCIYYPGGGISFWNFDKK